MYMMRARLKCPMLGANLRNCFMRVPILLQMDGINEMRLCYAETVA